MANTFNLTDAVGKAMDAAFRYAGKFTSSILNVNDKVGKESQQFVKNGSSFDVNLKVRMRKSGTEGSISRAFDAQDIYYDSRPFAITDNSYSHQEIELDLEKTSLGQVKSDIIVPAKNAVVTGVEQINSKSILEIGNTILADSTGADIEDASALRDRLDEMGLESEDITCLLPSSIMSSIVNGTNTFFDAPSGERNMGWYEGAFKEAKDMAWMKSNLLPILTHGTANNGSFSGGVTPLGLVATNVTVKGNTIVLDGIGTDGTITKGSVIEIAGVNAVNNLSYSDLGYRAQFSVAETVTSSSGGVTLTLYEKLNDGSDDPSNSIQNVTKLPEDGDVVYLVGEVSSSYKVGCAYHKTAFMTGFIKVADPKGTKFSRFGSAVDGMVTGVEGICIEDYDNDALTNTFRTDCFHGCAGYRREAACRIMQKI